MRPTPHARRTAEPKHASSSGCCVLREGQARLPVTGCGEGGKVLGIVGICRQVAAPAGTHPDGKD